MTTKGLTREEAEKEYNDYLNNPNDYALNKVSFLLNQIWSSQYSLGSCYQSRKYFLSKCDLTAFIACM